LKPTPEKPERSQGSTPFWHDHFGVALFGGAHFVASPFWSGSFLREFHENSFFFFFFFQFF